MRPDSHEIYGRRRSRNLGLGLTLGAFVVLIFAVTVVKLFEGEDDARLRPHLRDRAAAGGLSRWPRAPLEHAGSPSALAAVCGVMVGASFAAVPFYSWFCQVTGYGGTTNVAAAPRRRVLDRAVTVRFDANTAPDMPWEFRPKQQTMTLRLGETGLAFYEAYNPTDQVVAGQAGYNVVPFEIGALLRQDRLLLLRPCRCSSPTSGSRCR